MHVTCHDGTTFRLSSTSLPLHLDFTCSVLVAAETTPAFGAWQSVGPDTWVSWHAEQRVRQKVTILADHERRSIRLLHTVDNTGPAAVTVHGIRTVTGELHLASRPQAEVQYLHALNARHGLSPLVALAPGVPSIPLGRVSYPFFEGLAVGLGNDQPCLVTGPMTQKLVHRCQQLCWDGERSVGLGTTQDLRGIASKRIPAGATLELDGVFVQFRAGFDANTVFEDYLATLRQCNGTRWEHNPLRHEHFHTLWNNHLYWMATSGDILAAGQSVRQDYPGAVRWMGVDDGYQHAWVQPRLARRIDGEFDYQLETELIWYRNCPGVSFGFPQGLGEDQEKFPEGLIALAQRIKELGLRPLLWLGMEISTHHPLCQEHPDWFLPITSAEGSHALLDVSVPAVREQIEHVFATYYGAHGWQAVKLDFWSQLFERPDIVFREDNCTAAEWRRWFFEMIRRHLPVDGFISLGCDLAMGAPWVAPWVDSYRFSMDMRDGDWENVKSNVRWSMVPALTHGFEQPIGDCDSLSMFKGLSVSERTCWADYSHQIGSVVETSGKAQIWSPAEQAWLRAYLDEPRGGQGFWIGDVHAWARDGLPRVVSRWRRTPSGTMELITSLHNWSDLPQTIAFQDWATPAAAHEHFRNLRTGEAGNLTAATVFHLQPRSSCLLHTT